MRVVLDSNVIIAAFATRGICAEVFEVCLEGHTIVTSEQILDEVRKALVKKIRLPVRTALEIVTYVKNIAETVQPENIKIPLLRDPDDAIVLSAAMTGNAYVVITGDKDFLILGRYKNIRIVTPRDFWKRLRKK